MPYLTADSFGGLGNLAVQDERDRRLSFQNAMSNLQQGIAQAHAVRARQQEMAVRQQEINRQIEMDRQRNELGRGYLEQQRRMVDYQTSQPSPTQQRKMVDSRNTVNEYANQGLIENPDHALSVDPSLSDDEAGIVATRSMNARKGIDAEFDRAHGTAAVLNRANALQQSLNMANRNLQAAQKGDHWYSSSADLKTAQKAKDDAQAALTDFSPRVNLIKEDKRLNSLVSYDPQSDSYVSAVATPQWRSRPSATQAPAGAHTQVQNDSSVNGTSPAPATSGTGTAGYEPMHSPLIYNRVNELVRGGMAPVAAKRKALSERDEALFGTGAQRLSPGVPLAPDDIASPYPPIQDEPPSPMIDRSGPVFQQPAFNRNDPRLFQQPSFDRSTPRLYQPPFFNR